MLVFLRHTRPLRGTMTQFAEDWLHGWRLPEGSSNEVVGAVGIVVVSSETLLIG